MNKFSILISVYSKEISDNLNDCLKSVFNQTQSPNDIVLVEDGTLTEDLYSVIEFFCDKYPNIINRIKLEKNMGLGVALNEGLKYCRYELVARMDTDDICFPDRFEKQVKFMIAHPEVDVCSSWVEEFEGSVDNVKSLKKVPLSHNEIASYIGLRNPMNHPAVMFRKSSVLKVGGYKHFPLFEDWYLWSRMFINGACFANIQEPLLHFRTSPEMFKRRGGVKYAIDSAKFQWLLHKLGIISAFMAIKASIMRGTVYLMPNWVRTIIYSKYLRS